MIKIKASPTIDKASPTLDVDYAAIDIEGTYEEISGLIEYMKFVGIQKKYENMPSRIMIDRSNSPPCILPLELYFEIKEGLKAAHEYIKIMENNEIHSVGCGDDHKE